MLFFRALVVYSFIFYMMCVYFLAVLPLPSIEEVARETKPWAQLKPFAGLQSALREGGFKANDPQTWLRVLGTSSFFHLAANVAMLFPLGIYLRYYFRQGFFGAVRWGFLVSLSLELLQLTGLLFIYPRPYRLFDVDRPHHQHAGRGAGLPRGPAADENTALAGKARPRGLPQGRARFHLPRGGGGGRGLGAVRADRRASLGRAGRAQRQAHLFIYIASVLVYFIFIQYLTGGRTLGKALCRVRLVREDGGRPKFWQVAVRCISLYLILLAAPWAGFSAWNGMIDATGWRFFALGAAAILCLGVFAIFVFTCFINLITRASRLPHERLSRTRNQSTVRRAEDI